ncbi:hypothetical protein F3Y22_tig00110482pilonHSYRG00838 [Hibiscus syriacus]|uniref:Pentatricopeptide repeat-containing protein n=1 Tax=Hibiscus syriacus TaxID=106335 RepID=A0A6A3ADZ1_HIBSY|nr:hypothetical protein F3Y22_tig00110482pilonHSYRG00838 [Hibiscus syriacus]
MRAEPFSCFLQEGLIFEAVDTVHTMRKQGLKPDVVPYTTLVDAYCKKGMVYEAEVIVDTMRRQGIEPDVVMYSTLVDARCKKGMVSKTKDIFDTMRKQGIEPDVVMIEPNVVTHHSYARYVSIREDFGYRGGKLEEALKVFRAMQQSWPYRSGKGTFSDVDGGNAGEASPFPSRHSWQKDPDEQV